MAHKLISLTDTTAFIDWSASVSLELEYQRDKHQLVFMGPETSKIYLRLPIQADFEEETNTLVSGDKHWILLLVRAGNASIGYFENGETIDHKTFRAYMVRKKQGKSQVKYLNTKGKSRAGSRVRLASTEVFFREIGERLEEYLKLYHIDHIGIACAKTLWPYLFNPKYSPLEKKDPRIFNIPKHIQHPSYESLLETNVFMQMGELKWEDHDPVIQRFFASLDEKGTGENDDW